MAIYHCSLRVFTRSKGHSAVAAAAYRAGARLWDEYAGRWHRFEARSGVLSAFILAPPNSPEKYLSRAVLWNAAEQAEVRKNSRVAREVILALPHELSDKERADLTRDMALYLVDRYAVAVDSAIHAPPGGDGHDERNHHAHLLFSTRVLGEDGFGKKTRVLDDKAQGPKEIEIIRQVWEVLANDALRRAGFEDVQIDRRTLEEQGIDRIPQTHIGPKSKAAEERRDEEEESEDGKGEGSSDPLSLKLKSAIKEDHKGRTIDYGSIDQGKARSIFLKEVSELNAQREALGDVPLDVQIKSIEQLIDTLDGRIDRLGDLLKRTSTSDRLQKAIAVLLLRAKDMAFAKEHRKAEREVSKEKKKRRAKRQLGRYGRTYRAGVHEQIRDMREGIKTLKELKRRYKALKRFTEKIEDEIKANSAPSIDLKADKELLPVKTISASEVSYKISLKAEMIRAEIPEEFKPAARISSEFKPKGKAQEILSKGKPIEIKSAQLDLKREFAQSVEVKPIRKPPRLRRVFEVPKAYKQTEKNKDWFTPASKNMRPLQRLIEDKIDKDKEPKRAKDSFKKRSSKREPVKQVSTREHSQKIRQEAYQKRKIVAPKYQPKQEKPKSEKRNDKVHFKELEREISKKQDDKKGQSLRSKFNSTSKPEEAKRPEPKPVKTEEVLERLKEKAQTLREKIPLQFRARPYPDLSQITKTASEIGKKIQKAFKPYSKPKMSTGFNNASGLNQSAHQDYGPDSAEEPETEI